MTDRVNAPARNAEPLPTWLLGTIQAITGLAAVAALIITLVAIQTSRTDAARDSCHLLRGLVRAATSNAPRQRAAALAYVSRTPLRNCNRYAQDITR